MMETYRKRREAELGEHLYKLTALFSNLTVPVSVWRGHFVGPGGEIPVLLLRMRFIKQQGVVMWAISCPENIGTRLLCRQGGGKYACALTA